MIKQHYEKASRRALNIIWNAAGRYDLDPCFVAFHSNGQADDYFNTIIGLTDKWLGLERVAAFFKSFEGHRQAEEFDEFLWLGIENFVYEKELPERPVLESMRKTRGEQFFKIQQTLSEQQMTMQSMPVYFQQQARWAAVTGRHLPLLDQKAKRMYDALQLPGSLDPDGVFAALRDFLREFFRYDPVTDPKEKRPLTGFRAWYHRLTSHAYRQTDVLLIRTGSGLGDPENAVALHWDERKPPARSEKQDVLDQQYIESLFGPCRLSEAERKQAEAFLCTGSDAGCRLWFAGGNHTAADMPYMNNGPAHDPHTEKEAEDARHRMQHQYERNRSYLETHKLLIDESIKKLSSELEVLLSSFSRGLPENARAGRLLPEKAYRIGLLHDPYVFTREGDEREVNLTVDLLLDASQSRMNSQERISSEAYMIAKSFSACHVPVSVTAFRSLRGFTVLEELKSAEIKNCDGILRYYAGGWNRDGLALKAMRYLINDSRVSGYSLQQELKSFNNKAESGSAQPLLQGYQADTGEARNNAFSYNEDLHLLLILTDASPNDTVQSSSFGKNYEGSIAVSDAAAAVKALRSDGIRTAAVFHGSTSHLENVYRIYGKEYVRVQSLQQFSGSVMDLLQMTFSEN